MHVTHACNTSMCLGEMLFKNRNKIKNLQLAFVLPKEQISTTSKD
jgi:hypothetical protein